MAAPSDWINLAFVCHRFARALSPLFILFPITLSLHSKTQQQRAISQQLQQQQRHIAMDRTMLKLKEHHGSSSSTTTTQAQSQPPPKLIYGTSIDYQERAKRLRLTGPPPDHDLNPFNAPTVNKIENMFERVMSIARSSSSLSSASQPARRHDLFAPPPPQSSSFSSTRNTYERHQTKPEEKDTIASTFTHPRHEQPRQSAFSLSPSSRNYIPVSIATSPGHHRYSRPPIPSVWSTLSTQASTSEADEKANRYRYMLPPMDAPTTTLARPTATNRPTQEEPQQQQHKQEPVYQQPPRALVNTQAAVVPPSVPMKRPFSPEPPGNCNSLFYTLPSYWFCRCPACWRTKSSNISAMCDQKNCSIRGCGR